MWQLDRTFTSDGTYRYNITCSKGGYTTQVASSYVATGASTPRIAFVSPTPPSGNSTTGNSVYLNTTVSDVVNTSAFFDWNRSMVGYWSFEYYNSSGIFDNSTYKNFGSFNGGLSTSNITTGKYGKGLTFDGVDDYVDAGNPTPLQSTGSVTISAWIYIKSVNSGLEDDYIISKDSKWVLKGTEDTGPETIGLYVNSDDYIQAQRYGNTVLSLDTWYHVVGVYNSWGRSI
jgi:hypothetical protein